LVLTFIVMVAYDNLY